MSEHGLDTYVSSTVDACRRWSVPVSVPSSSTPAQAAVIIRSALMRAAKIAIAFPAKPGEPEVPLMACHDDNSWTRDGVRGLTAARLAGEALLAADPMSPSSEEWGIIARVTAEGLSFDVPIALDLDADSARNILSRMTGREAEFVDLDAVSVLSEGGPFSVQFQAGNWAALRDNTREADVSIEDAFAFRRPVVWDMLRARLSDMPPEPLPAFTEEIFYSRMAKSVRHDAAMMSSNRDLLARLAPMEVDPTSVRWAEWHPAVVDLLATLGKPMPMDGMSVIINAIVMEPVEGQDRPTGDDPDLVPYDRWAPVGFHNVVVACGLHPLSAVHLLDLVLEDPAPFHDLPVREDRLFRVIGASAIHDSMLSSLRVSTTGRGPGYDALVAGEARREAEAAAAATPAPAAAELEPDAIAF